MTRRSDSLADERDRLLADLAANRARPDQDSGDCQAEHRRLRKHLAGIEADILLDAGDQKGYLASMRLVAEFSKQQADHYIARLEEALTEYAKAFRAIEAQQYAATTLADLDELDNPGPPDIGPYALPASWAPKID